MDDSEAIVVSKCPQCERIFTTERSLSCHVKIHNERHLTCLFCDRSFNRTDLLFLHVLDHLLKNPIECRVEKCTFVVKSIADGERHVTSDHSDGIKCCECSQEQSNFRKLMLHYVFQHSELKQFGDEMLAKQREFLLKKKRENRRKAPKTTGNSMEIPEKRGRVTKNEPEEGEEPEQNEPEPNEHEEHEEQEEEDKLLELLKMALVQQTDDTDTMLQKLSDVVAELFPLTADNQYQCVHCAVSFSDAILWMMHLKFHDPLEPFRCTGCSRSFSNRQTFQLHLTWFAHGAATSGGLAEPESLGE